MFMFLKIAFGNIVKNWKNSLTILIVVFVCVFTMQFGTGYVDGFKKKITTDFLQQAGHVNVFNETYYKSMDFSLLEYNVPYSAVLADKLGRFPDVSSLRPEINFGAIANTEKENLQCLIKAVDIKGIEANYGLRKKSVIEGSFILGDKDIVLGYKAASLLKVKPGDKLVLLSVDQYGSMSAVEGVISGLFKSNNAMEDETLIVCGLPLAQKLFAMEGRVTSIAVNFKNPASSVLYANELQKILPQGMTAVPWQEGQAFIVNMLKMFDVLIGIMAFVIIFAASMGIINSFLMNIMNRLPEYGVLRAIGMGRGQLFMMIITESFLLGVIGTGLAMIPGTIIVKHFEAHPMNFDNIWKVMEGSGIGSMDATIGMVYLPASVAIVVLTGILISVVASIYPAMIAANKKPSDIMRVLE
jgi:putative ABC transport system permease protein